mmetsp:Transcript_97087/g.296719  ORF Transcript_97087/g.296719 Transcript_97087/m.296719 type:complete len:252 (-) Transcript_97087:71-826(-)
MRSWMAASTRATDLYGPWSSPPSTDTLFCVSRMRRSSCVSCSLIPASSACASWNLPKMSDKVFGRVSCSRAFNTFSIPWAVTFSRLSTLPAQYVFMFLSRNSASVERAAFSVLPSASVLASLSASNLFSRPSKAAVVPALRLLSRPSALAAMSAFKPLARPSALAATSARTPWSRPSALAAMSAFKRCSRPWVLAAISAFKLCSRTSVQVVWWSFSRFSQNSRSAAASARAARTAASTGPASAGCGFRASR